MATPSDAKPVTMEDLYGVKEPEVEKTFFPESVAREPLVDRLARERDFSANQAKRISQAQSAVSEKYDAAIKDVQEQLAKARGSIAPRDRENRSRLEKQLKELQGDKSAELELRLSQAQQPTKPTEPKGLITGDLRSIQADVNIPMAGLFSGVRAEQRAAAREAGRDLEGMRRTIRSELEEASAARLRMAEVDRMAAAEQVKQKEAIAKKNEETQAALDTARAAQDAAVKQHMDEIDTINQDIRDFKVDQGRAFPDTTSKVAMVIATAMGSLAEGLSQGRLPNTALKLMNDAIDRDIRLQLSELDNMKDAVKNKHNVVACKRGYEGKNW